MICPICRNDIRTADQIICADCKASNPYNLLGGYSTTKSISEELKKIGPYEQQLKRQKKLLKTSLAIILALMIVLILGIIFGTREKLPVATNVSDATEKLEVKIDSLKKQLLKNEQESVTVSESKTQLSGPENSNPDSINNELESTIAGYKADLNALKQSNSAKEQELISLKSQVKELESSKGINTGGQLNSASQVHVVLSGESLSSIALRYYGSENEFNRILADNNIADANKIYVGQELKIRK